jgi:hypothetical protein
VTDPAHAERGLERVAVAARGQKADPGAVHHDRLVMVQQWLGVLEPELD